MKKIYVTSEDYRGSDNPLLAACQKRWGIRITKFSLQGNKLHVNDDVFTITCEKGDVQTLLNLEKEFSFMLW